LRINGKLIDAQNSMIQLKKIIQDVLNISQIIDQLYTNIGWHLYFEHEM
jgi:hypothetical protein